MSRLDEELRERLHGAQAPVRVENVVGMTIERSRRVERRRRIGSATLVVSVLALTVAGFVGLRSLFQAGPPALDTPTPTVSVAPSPDGAALTLVGVPFPVCRPMSIPGEFGYGFDTIWVFQEEHQEGDGCEVGEGFQHVGIGTATAVSVMSGRLTECLDLNDCWPAAAVDLDGDGVDEFAVCEILRPGSMGLVFYRLVLLNGGPARLRPIEAVCNLDAACTRSGLFSVDSNPGMEAGLFCRLVSREPTSAGFTQWKLEKDGDGWWFQQWEATAAGFVGTGGWVSHGQPGNFFFNEDIDPGDSGSSLCGRPLVQLDDIDPVRAQHVIEALG